MSIKVREGAIQHTNYGNVFAGEEKRSSIMTKGQHGVSAYLKEFTIEQKCA